MHVREPMMVEHLGDMKIIDIAVGALHCLALNDQGEVIIFLYNMYHYDISINPYFHLFLAPLRSSIIK